jgi:hypothetical protein
MVKFAKLVIIAVVVIFFSFRAVLLLQMNYISEQSKVASYKRS